MAREKFLFNRPVYGGCVIYAIMNRKKMTVYVGQTTNLKNRAKQHDEQLYKGNHVNKNGIFTRKNDKLIEDTGLSHNTLNKAKKELVDTGYIETWQNSLYQDGTHTKLTTFKVCYYRLLK